MHGDPCRFLIPSSFSPSTADRRSYQSSRLHAAKIDLSPVRHYRASIIERVTGDTLRSIGNKQTGGRGIIEDRRTRGSLVTRAVNLLNRPEISNPQLSRRNASRAKSDTLDGTRSRPRASPVKVRVDFGDVSAIARPCQVDPIRRRGVSCEGGLAGETAARCQTGRTLTAY